MAFIHFYVFNNALFFYIETNHMLKIIEENISLGTTKLMRIIWKHPIAFYFFTRPYALVIKNVN